MAESIVPAWFRSWTGANLSATAFASVGFTFGAILWMIAPRLGYDP